MDKYLLHNLKRKRARERASITRFVATVEEFTDDTSLEDYEHYKGRLEDTLALLMQQDNAIHDLLSDEDYDADIIACEDYIDKAKRAIQKAAKGIEKRLFAATAALTLNHTARTRSMDSQAPIVTSANLPVFPVEKSTDTSKQMLQMMSSIQTRLLSIEKKVDNVHRLVDITYKSVPVSLTSGQKPGVARVADWGE